MSHATQDEIAAHLLTEGACQDCGCGILTPDDALAHAASDGIACCDHQDRSRVALHRLAGHSEQCAGRLVWEDGNCECGIWGQWTRDTPDVRGRPFWVLAAGYGEHFADKPARVWMYSDMGSLDIVGMANKTLRAIPLCMWWHPYTGEEPPVVPVEVAEDAKNRHAAVLAAWDAEQDAHDAQMKAREVSP